MKSLYETILDNPDDNVEFTNKKLHVKDHTQKVADQLDDINTKLVNNNITEKQYTSKLCSILNTIGISKDKFKCVKGAFDKKHTKPEYWISSELHLGNKPIAWFYIVRSKAFISSGHTVYVYMIPTDTEEAKLFRVMLEQLRYIRMNEESTLNPYSGPYFFHRF